MVGLNNPTNVSASVMASSLSVDDILKGYSAKGTSLEKQSFMSTYEGARIYGIGSFVDIAKAGDGYLVTTQTSKGIVSCQFNRDAETEKRLLLMEKGRTIAFTGVFTNSVVWGGGWSVKDCSLEILQS